MAYMTSSKCHACGTSYSSFSRDFTLNCSQCKRAKKLRAEYGDGEASDQLLAFTLGPDELDFVQAREALARLRMDVLSKHVRRATESAKGATT